MPPRRAERHQQHTAGRFTLDTLTTPGGAVLLSISYTAPGGARQTVAHLSGYPDAGPGAVLLNVADAYDSTNRLAIAPGGGRPAEVLAKLAAVRPCDRCGKDLGRLPAGAPPPAYSGGAYSRCADCRDVLPGGDVEPNVYDRMARRAESREAARPRCPRCGGPLAEVPGRPPYCPRSVCPV